MAVWRHHDQEGGLMQKTLVSSAIPYPAASKRE
jgi:hypothetical protein